MTLQIDKIAKVYRSVAQIPFITGARISHNSNGSVVTSEWSQRNLIRSRVEKFTRSYVLDKSHNLLSMIYNEKVNEILFSISPSETHRAVIVQSDADTQDKKKQFLQVWSSGQLSYCIDLSALDIHGDVYADSEFGTLEWSPCETKLVYIAEKKKPKSEPFFKTKPSTDKSGDSEPLKGEEYLFEEEWGENLVGKVQSVLAICNLKDEVTPITVADQIPDYLCPAQARWSVDGSIVGIAWDIRPRKLGLIYCTNRLSHVFSLSSTGEYSILSAENNAVRSPRFSPNGSILIWLERPTGGPHLATHKLMKLQWPAAKDAKPEVLIDHVPIWLDVPGGKKFFGLYALELPNRCWFGNNQILLSTVQRVEVKSYLVNIDTLTLKEIPLNLPGQESDKGSLSILDVKDGTVIAACSSIQRPSQLLIGNIDCSANISWTTLSKSDLIDGLQNNVVEYLDLSHDTDEEVNNYSAIYYGPPKSEDGIAHPLIVWPHGGPHSSFANGYSPVTSFFALLGFSMVQINYRGSTGQGQKSIDFLPGRVGTSDVQDCQLARNTVIEQYNADPKRCVLFGGSHGGFLVAHLSGQFPDAYCAVVARNPVIDISAMAFISDIPDWCAVEAGYDYSEKGPLDEEILTKMRHVSPIMYAHQVKAATLLMVGSNDLRVPPSQAISYYKRLKVNGCETKMFIYKDNHPLGTPAAETDNLINSAIWFMQHTKSSI